MGSCDAFQKADFSNTTGDALPPILCFEPLCMLLKNCFLIGPPGSKSEHEAQHRFKVECRCHSLWNGAVQVFICSVPNDSSLQYMFCQENGLPKSFSHLVVPSPNVIVHYFLKYIFIFCQVYFLFLSSFHAFLFLSFIGFSLFRFMHFISFSF